MSLDGSDSRISRSRDRGFEADASEPFNRILGVALQVANDVIPFDFHRVYLSWKDRDRNWSFHEGFGSEDEEDLGRSRAYHARLNSAEKPVLQFEENGRWVCLANLEIGEDEQEEAPLLPLAGYLAIARNLRAAPAFDGPADAGRFTAVEEYHLEKVADLILAAIADERAFDLLRRLHLNFLHRRTTLQQLPFEAILREYMLKAAHVLHDLEESHFRAGSGGGHPRSVVRLTAKVVNNSRTALQIVDQLSTRPDEWTKRRRQTSYPLPEAAAPGASFAATAFRQLSTVRPEDYRGQVPPRYRLFDDTRHHMTAPIVAGRDGILGVLSVETTEARPYDASQEAALTLLAGQAAWPLRNVREKWDSTREAQVLSDAILGLRSETSEARLLEVLARKLEASGYRRGMISRVEREGELYLVNGVLSWGGAAMKAVERVTRRNSRDHARDCQILAASLREPQVDIDPDDDLQGRVEKTARAVGRLRTFGVYPVLDNHGRPLWTLHLERRDVARQNDFDATLIDALGNRVMKAWEEERRTRFERSWTEQMMEASFFSLNELLARFADCIAGPSGVVRRCRVFLVSPAGEQVPYHQAGAGQSADFRTLTLGPEDALILESELPLLFLRPGAETDLRECEEFGVVRDGPDRHEEALHNEGRSQWVEIPVRSKGRPVAKIALDHFDRATTPSDAFTLGEMRLLARLSHLLSVAAEAAQAYKAIAELCCSGLQVRLLQHFLMRSFDCLRMPAGGADPGVNRQEIDRIKTSLEELEDFLQNYDAHRRRDPSPEATTISSVLGAARDACGYLQDHYGIDEIGVLFAGEDAALSPREKGALFFIVITLLENSCKMASRLTDDRSTGYSAGDAPPPGAEGDAVRVQAGVASTAEGIEVLVRDSGRGIESAEMRQVVRESLRDPVKALSRGHAGGLTLAAFLAREHGWRIELRGEPGWATTFAVVIPRKESGARP